MEMKRYLIDTFRYNNSANKMVLESMKELADKDECIKIMCHIIKFAK